MWLVLFCNNLKGVFEWSFVLCLSKLEFIMLLLSVLMVKCNILFLIVMVLFLMFVILVGCEVFDVGILWDCCWVWIWVCFCVWILGLKFCCYCVNNRNDINNNFIISKLWFEFIGNFFC